MPKNSSMHGIWYSNLCFSLHLTAWLCRCCMLTTENRYIVKIFNPLAWHDGGTHKPPRQKIPLQLDVDWFCRVRRWYSGVRCGPVWVRCGPVRLIVTPAFGLIRPVLINTPPNLSPITLGEKWVKFGPQTKKLWGLLLIHLNGFFWETTFWPLGVLPPQIFTCTTDWPKLASSHPNGDGISRKKISILKIKIWHKIQHVSPYNFGASGSILTKLFHTTCREAGMITWV